MVENSYKHGVKDGLPICFGYFAVSFAFGIFAYESGLSVWQSVSLSFMNFTSAGQFAAVPIIVGTGTLIELFLSQLIINLRYSIMSVSLSQKFDKNIHFYEKFLMAFMNTDEIFAVAVSKQGKIGSRYYYGLMLLPFFGWTGGTLLGAAAGNVLPGSVVTAMGVAIYAMFMAIVIPPAKKDKAVALCCVAAIALSCLFRYVGVLSKIPEGFTIIICAVAAAIVAAVLFPVKEQGGVKNG